MKKYILHTAILALVCCFSTYSFAQGQGKGNQKKEQSPAKENKGKSKVDNSEEKLKDPSVRNDDDPQKDKYKDKNKVKTNKGNDDVDYKVKEKENNGRGREDVRKVINNHGNDKPYDWNRETFKDRHKLRNEKKVTVCHKFNRGNEQGVEISISRNALKAHLGHGDIEGTCPANTRNGTYSDKFLGMRRDYYNSLYGAQDQVVYSQSVLDYALQRLTGARTQLVTLQNNNAPGYEIERKQAVVTDLENNVSLLETAVAAVAGLLVAKLVN